METLGQKQERFAIYVAQLILQARQLGYGVRLGEVARSDEQAEINAIGYTGRLQVASKIRDTFPYLASAIENNGKNNGIRNSGHRNGLALDVKLFRDGNYLTQDSDYRVLGDWWKSLAPDCRWGGDFPGDGNHFSIEYQGVK